MSTRRALAFSFLDRYSGLVLAIVSSMIIARLLTPAEIGIFSVTTVLLSFISNMRDMGAGQYLLQEKELTQERIRATWTVQIGLGLLFAVVVLIGAYPVAQFYDEPRMRNLMFVLALNFAISPFGSITYAWLMREMRFDQLAIMRFFSGLLGAIVAVTMAWRDYGPMSLAVGSLVSTITQSCIATALRPPNFPWLPGRKGIRRVLSFGSKISLNTILGNVATSTPDVLLAKFSSMAAAGLYSRANGLATMFYKLVIDATFTVAIPLFAKESRQFGTIVPTFLKATAYVTALGWPFFAFIGIFAEPVLTLLYGSQWTDSVELTRLISLGLTLGLPSVFVSVALTSIGHVNLLSRLTAIVVAQFIVTMAIGAYFGLGTIGWAYVIGTTINAVIWVLASRKAIGFEVGKLLGSLVKSVLVTLTTTIAPLAVAAFVPSAPWHGNMQLLVAIPLTAAAFVASVVAWKHPLALEMARATAMFRRRPAT